MDGYGHLLRYQMMNIHVFYESLKELIAITAKGKEDKTKRMASLFVFSSIISVVGFIATNIAILPIDNKLNLYLFQFVISSVIGALYWPFFLTCLFLILSPRSLCIIILNLGTRVAMVDYNKICLQSPANTI